MRLLYHYWLSPASRKIRLVLAEKKLECELKLEKHWERRAEFLALNPAGDLPVLVEDNGLVVAHGTAIAEYLDETFPEPPLLGKTPAQRAEARRLVGWFDEKFNREVTDPLVGEKVLRRIAGMGEPDSRVIRVGSANIHAHLDYIAWLTERRTWLAGDFFSLADLAAGAHLSAIDYVGDVPWEDHPGAKDYYARLKSRPSFRPLLNDRVPGLAPPTHYADLDF